MQTWQQIYDPFGNLWLSALVAAIPIIFFFVALTVFRLKGHIAGTITVVLSLAVAILSYGMPVSMALAGQAITWRLHATMPTSSTAAVPIDSRIWAIDTSNPRTTWPSTWTDTTTDATCMRGSRGDGSSTG